MMNPVRRGLEIAVSAALCLPAGCRGADGEGAMNREASGVVRESYGAGKWFPGTRAQLESMVSGFINDARPPPVEGRIVAAIAPHAGYVYSGRTAGYTFRAIMENAATNGAPDAVVVLGFPHRAAFRGVALMDGSAIRTPLGPAELDGGTAAELAAASQRIKFNGIPHAGEHSAENEIPFVQAALPGVKLVVGLIGDHDPETLNELVNALVAASRKRKLLVVASTDLLHDPDYDRVVRTDKQTLSVITSMDAPKLASMWSYAGQLCCGIGPVLTAMRYAEAMGSRKGTLLHYRNSGDDFPESRGEWVVGYGAVAFGAAESR